MTPPPGDRSNDENGLLPEAAAVVLVAHPVHVLRVWGVVARARPAVCAITDGSGGAGRANADIAAEVLREAGATTGPAFGAVPDRDAYRMLMGRRHGELLAFAGRVAGLVRRRGARLLVHDAAEGFNPAHDAACLLAGFVAEAARCWWGMTVRRRAFLLEGPPDSPGSAAEGDCLRVALTDAEFADKMRHAARLATVVPDVASQLAEPDRHRVEWLLPADDSHVTPDATGRLGKPYYETFGERRVAEGRYTEVLRRGDVLALRDSLERWLDAGPDHAASAAGEGVSGR